MTTFAELVAQYKAIVQVPEVKTGMPSVSEFGMTITMTPVISWEDAVAALDLVTHADTNFDPSLTDSTVEKLRKYIEQRLPEGHILRS